MPDTNYPTLITSSLIEAIRSRYALDWHGIHGVSHWARVRNNGFNCENGRELAAEWCVNRAATGHSQTNLAEKWNSVVKPSRHL